MYAGRTEKIPNSGPPDEQKKAVWAERGGIHRGDGDANGVGIFLLRKRPALTSVESDGQNGPAVERHQTRQDVPPAARRIDRGVTQVGRHRYDGDPRTEQGVRAPLLVYHLK